MADSLSTIGSIATVVYNSFSNVPAGISGTIIQIVDAARQNVENYVGQDIGSNSIADQYQPAILNFAKADVLELVIATPGYFNISLDQLSISAPGALTAGQYRMMAEMTMKNLGRKVNYAKSIS